MHTNKTDAYKDPQKSIEFRVRDLLNKMTIDEKISQLKVIMGWLAYEKHNGKLSAPIGIEPNLKKPFTELFSEGPGIIYGLLRSDTVTGKNLDSGLSPYEGAEVVNLIQKFIIEKSRLGIPTIFEEETQHGHMSIGATVFPTGIGMASTWNKNLIQKIGSVVATEMRARGGTMGLSPVLDISRDPRWSRVEESFGEDPYLTAELGKSMVLGLQGEKFDNNQIISCIKHFAGYGNTEGGHNGSPCIANERTIREVYLPAFEACFAIGAKATMSAYNEVDGIPLPANKWLLTDVLRKEWKFDGVVISDAYSIRRMIKQRIAKDRIDAAALALNAGTDLDQGADSYTDGLLSAINKGLVSIATVDEAVSRVLRLKFLLGLFEQPYVNPERAQEVIGNKKNRNISLEVARQSIVLLKNKNKLLPLNKNIKTIAVIGPNANNIYNQLGDYTACQHRNNVVTILDGIKAKTSKQTKVIYAKGCSVIDKSKAGFSAAILAAKQADVVIVAIGGSSSRYDGVKAEITGEAITTSGTKHSDMDNGEGFDRATLDLAGVQNDLLRKLHGTGVPIVAVMINGRPMTVGWLKDNVDAILEAWYPGVEGGNAIADILFGDYNPSGKLPISFPAHVGELPVYYNYRPTARRNYVFSTGEPLFSFGDGLSYTTFSYQNLKITPEEINTTGNAKVEVTVLNSGDIQGEEVVQLYICDEYSSVTRPVRELKGFQKISLAPREKKIVKFVISNDELKFLDHTMKWTVEPGNFKIMIGGNQHTLIEADLKVTE